MHHSISHFIRLLSASLLLQSQVFVWYVQYRRLQRISGRHPPTLPRGVLGRPLVEVVGALPPPNVACPLLPVRVRRAALARSCIHVLVTYGGLARSAGIALVSGPVVLMVTLSFAYSLLVTASRVKALLKVARVHVRLT